MNSFRIVAPSSKSEFQREVAISLLCDMPSTIRFNSLSDDSLTAIRLADEIGTLNVNKFFYDKFKKKDLSSFQSINIEYLQKLYSDLRINSKVFIDDENQFVVSVSGGNSPFIQQINCGESGLALHLFSGILAAQSKRFTIIGEGTICKRRQNDLVGSFRNIGLEVFTIDNRLPINISGQINKFDIKLGKLSGSQTLSALFLAYSKLGQNTKIEVDEFNSHYYAAMTIQALARHGVIVKNDNFQRFSIQSNQIIESADIQIEGCWSSISFWCILGALGHGIIIEGLNSDSLQPDRAITQILEAIGARIIQHGNIYEVLGSENSLKAFTFDATNCPDLIPNLVVLAAFCEGSSEIIGVNRLENKESNRAEAILNEFSKIGIDIQRDNDRFIIRQSKINDAKVSAHSDHRIIMALELASALSKKNIQIDETKNVSKSYPEFYTDLENWKKYLSESI